MIIEKVKEILEKDLDNIGLVIDEVKYVKEGGINYLRIFLDSNDIIDIDKCVEATNIINPILDKASLIEESYILDVTTKEKGENNE